MGMSANNVPNVSFEEVKRASESGDTMIVDVRREDEVKSSGIIPNSVQIPCTLFCLKVLGYFIKLLFSGLRKGGF